MLFGLAIPFIGIRINLISCEGISLQEQRLKDHAVFISPRMKETS